MLMAKRVLLFIFGALGGIRTPDAGLRTPALYPTELRGHSFSIVSKKREGQVSQAMDKTFGMSLT